MRILCSECVVYSPHAALRNRHIKKLRRAIRARGAKKPARALRSNLQTALRQENLVVFRANLANLGENRALRAAERMVTIDVKSRIGRWQRES